MSTDQYCCEEHYPSEAMTPEEQAEHVCPVCSWSASAVVVRQRDAYRACLVRLLNSAMADRWPAIEKDIEDTLAANRGWRL